MRISRTVVVLDAADPAPVSAFWAAVLGGTVVVEDGWHSVLDADGEPRIDVQLAPDHVDPDWPHGQQQVHLDLYVEDREAAHTEVLALGARLLQEPGEPGTPEDFTVYADPAGHPFCLCGG